jgi:hypothetical protein
MGYRGEDSARDRAAWETQSPRQSPSGQWPVSDESWSSASRGHEARGYDENSTEHAGYAGNRHADGSGYAASDNYADYDGYGQRGDYGAGSYSPADYNSTDYNSAGYGSTDYGSTADYNGGGPDGYADRYGDGGYSTSGSGAGGHGTGGHGTDWYGSGGYPAIGDRDTGGHATGRHSAGNHSAGNHSTGGYSTSGYGTGGYDSANRHDSGGYRAVSDHGPGSYPAPTSYDSPANRSGGYPTLGGPSGSYPTLGGRSGGYPALTSGQADEGIPSAYNDGNDWYTNGSGTPGAGFADTSTQIAIRDPIRGYPPDPARPESGVARTGAQLRYDESEHVSYPGHDEADDGGYGARRGYDDYDDYAPAGQTEYTEYAGHAEHATRLDQRAVDYDSPRGYGQALQGDDFDGGMYDGYGDEDVITSPAGARWGARADGRSARSTRNPAGTGPQKPPPGGDFRPKRSGASNKKVGGTKIVVAVVALLLVGTAGFAGYKFLTKSKSAATTGDLGKPLPTTSASASAATAQCVAQFGQFCHIQTRQLDPAPLTLDDLYPASFFSETAKVQFARSGAAEDKDCAKAVIGADLTKQLKTGQCSQVLRATYVSGDGTIMGTIGVINLVSTNQAHYAGKVIGTTNFIMPLAGTTGPTAKLGKGTGVVEAQYKGHYLILTWAEFVNQQTPSTTALTQQLENFENALVAGTANIVLSQRMINGDGPAAGAPASSSASATPSATKS